MTHLVRSRARERNLRSFAIMAVVFFMLMVSPVLQATGSGEAASDYSAETDEETVERLATMDPGAAQDELSSRSVDERVGYSIALAYDGLEAGSLARAEQWLEWGGGQVPEDDFPGLHAEILTERAVVSELGGNMRASVSFARRAARLFAQSGRSEDELSTLARLAGIQHRLGQLSDGIETADAVIDRLDELDDPLRQADVLSNAAMMRYKLGWFEEVPGLLDRAYERYEAEGNLDGMGTVYRFRGNYHGSRNDAELARSYYRKAAEKYEQTGNLHDLANVRFNSGLSVMQEGRYDDAVSYLEDAVDGFLEAGSVSGAGMASTELAVALWSAGRWQAADSALAIGIRMLDSSQSLRRLARAYSIRATFQGAFGNTDGALDSLNEARNLYDELGLRAEAAAIQDQIDELDEDTPRGGI